MFLNKFVHFSGNYLFTHFSENFCSPSENLFVQFSRTFVHSQRTYFILSEIKLLSNDNPFASKIYLVTIIMIGIF